MIGELTFSRFSLRSPSIVPGDGSPRACHGDTNIGRPSGPITSIGACVMNGARNFMPASGPLSAAIAIASCGKPENIPPIVELPLCGVRNRDCGGVVHDAAGAGGAGGGTGA